MKKIFYYLKFLIDVIHQISINSISKENIKYRTIKVKHAMFRRRIIRIYSDFVTSKTEAGNSSILALVSDLQLDQRNLTLSFEFCSYPFYLKGATQIVQQNFALIKTVQIINAKHVEIPELEIKVHADSKILFSTPKTEIITFLGVPKEHDRTEIPFSNNFGVLYLKQLKKYLEEIENS